MRITASLGTSSGAAAPAAAAESRLQADEEPRRQPSAGVRQLDPRAQRPGAGADLGQQRLHPAGERRPAERRAGLDPRAGSQACRLALGHLGMHPDGREPVDAHQVGAGRQAHAFAHHQLGHHAGARRGQGDGAAHAAAGLDLADLRLAHSGLAHAQPRRFDQRRQPLALHPAQGEELLLRRHPIRHVELDQRLPGGHPIQRGAHMQLLDEAGGAGLQQHLVALVPGHRADRLDLRRERALLDRRGADAQALLHPRADRNRAGVGGGTGVHRHQHHVHERRLARRVEALPGHHRVVVVEDLAAGGRVDVAGLEAALQVAPGGGLAGGDRIVAGVGRHARAGLRRPAMRTMRGAQPVQAPAPGRDQQQCGGRSGDDRRLPRARVHFGAPLEGGVCMVPMSTLAGTR